MQSIDYYSFLTDANAIQKKSIIPPKSIIPMLKLPIFTYNE